MSLDSGTSTSPVVMPDTSRYIISNSNWYVTGMRVFVHYDPKVVKKINNKVKIRLYTNRSFELHLRIDKKLTTQPTVTNLMRRLFIISTDGHKVSFRVPVINPPPAGSSIDSSKDIPIVGYGWKIKSYDWYYNFERNLYNTTAVLVGSWSKFCYRGANTSTYYSTT